MLISRSESRRAEFSRAAATLTEALLAAAILSIAFGLAFKLFWTGARSAELAAWHTKCQVQLRNGLKLLRDDLGHASYPSVISPTSVTVTKAGKGLRYHRGKVDLANNSGELPLLDFRICRPAKQGFDADDNDALGEEIHATLSAKGNAVWYRKTGAANPVRNYDRALFEEGDYILLEGPDSSPPGSSTTCTIEVKTVHKIWKQSGVVERTMPKIEVGVTGDL